MGRQPRFFAMAQYAKRPSFFNWHAHDDQASQAEGACCWRRNIDEEAFVYTLWNYHFREVNDHLYLIQAQIHHGKAK